MQSEDVELNSIGIELGVNFILSLWERLSTGIFTKGLNLAVNFALSLLGLNLSTAFPEFDGTALGKDLTFESEFCLNVIDASSLLYTKLTMEIRTINHVDLHKDSTDDLVLSETKL